MPPPPDRSGGFLLPPAAAPGYTRPVATVLLVNPEHPHVSLAPPPRPDQPPGRPVVGRRRRGRRRRQRRPGRRRPGPQARPAPRRAEALRHEEVHQPLGLPLSGPHDAARVSAT